MMVQEPAIAVGRLLDAPVQTVQFRHDPSRRQLVGIAGQSRLSMLRRMLVTPAFQRQQRPFGGKPPIVLVPGDRVGQDRIGLVDLTGGDAAASQSQAGRDRLIGQPLRVSLGGFLVPAAKQPTPCVAQRRLLGGKSRRGKPKANHQQHRWNTDHVATWGVRFLPLSPGSGGCSHPSFRSMTMGLNASGWSSRHSVSALNTAISPFHLAPHRSCTGGNPVRKLLRVLSPVCSLSFLLAPHRSCTGGSPVWKLPRVLSPVCSLSFLLAPHRSCTGGSPVWKPPRVLSPVCSLAFPLAPHRSCTGGSPVWKLPRVLSPVCSLSFPLAPHRSCTGGSPVWKLPRVLSPVCSLSFPPWLPTGPVPVGARFGNLSRGKRVATFEGAASKHGHLSLARAIERYSRNAL
jgi:hypothetical protein